MNNINNHNNSYCLLNNEYVLDIVISYLHIFTHLTSATNQWGGISPILQMKKMKLRSINYLPKIRVLMFIPVHSIENKKGYSIVVVAIFYRQHCVYILKKVRDEKPLLTPNIKDPRKYTLNGTVTQNLPWSTAQLYIDRD